METTSDDVGGQVLKGRAASAWYSGALQWPVGSPGVHETTHREGGRPGAPALPSPPSGDFSPSLQAVPVVLQRGLSISSDPRSELQMPKCLRVLVGGHRVLEWLVLQPRNLAQGRGCSLIQSSVLGQPGLPEVTAVSRGGAPLGTGD